MIGLYAFGCEKLRYKAEIQPSELMDPVTPFSEARGLMLGNVLMVSVRKVQGPP